MEGNGYLKVQIGEHIATVEMLVDEKYLTNVETFIEMYLRPAAFQILHSLEHLKTKV